MIFWSQYAIVRRAGNLDHLLLGEMLQSCHTCPTWGGGKIASKQAPFGSNGKLVGERVGAKFARRLVYDSHQDWSKLAGNLAPSPTKWGKWGKISRMFGNLAQIIPAHCTSKTKPSILML